MRLSVVPYDLRNRKYIMFFRTRKSCQRKGGLYFFPCLIPNLTLEYNWNLKERKKKCPWLSSTELCGRKEEDLIEIMDENK
jgi:hypothetical protein